MSNIETLRQEFIHQKDIILEKGGSVVVANDYPSPAEITEGIKSVITPDFTVATATEADVAVGKTFYSNSSQLKTGEGIFQADMINNLFMVDYNTATTEDRIYYSCPTGLKTIRKYCFYQNINPIHISFNPEITNIEEYAFHKATNMTFEGFNELTGLKNIGNYAFAHTIPTGINYSRVPSSVEELGDCAFYNVFNENDSDYRFPDSLTTLGDGSYRQSVRKVANSLDLSNYPLISLSSQSFYNVAFNCDFSAPEGFKSILTYCFYNGSFHNITFPSTLNRLANYCFGADSTRSQSDFYLKTVTFNGETLPGFGAKIFATQNIKNGFKIYVPDTVVEEYKAVSLLADYVSCIYPISEKE